MKIDHISIERFSKSGIYFFILLFSTIPFTNIFSFAEGVKAKVFIRARPFLVEGRRYLRLQQLKMDFSVQDIKMGVENVRNSNSILCKLPIFYKILKLFQKIE